MPPPTQTLKPSSPSLRDQLQPDVVELDRGAIGIAGDHRDLELARQEAEFGVEARPLAQQLGVGPRVGDLVGGGPGELVAR